MASKLGGTTCICEAQARSRGERESAVETIITRKGVSNHAQDQSNVEKKRAMIKTTLRARDGAGQSWPH